MRRETSVIRTLNLSAATRWGLNLLALLGVIGAIHFGQSILIPTIIALLLAALLWPVVQFLHGGLRFSWTFACLLAVLGLVVLNLAITAGLFLAVPKILQDIPDLREEPQQKEVYALFRERVGSFIPFDDQYLPQNPDESRLYQGVQQSLNGPYLKEALYQIAIYGNLWFWEWVLIMFVLLFLLLEGPMLSRRVVEIFGPSESAKNKAVQALTDMASSVRSYLVWRTIVNFGMALVVGLIYQYGFHLKQAWTWAILTSVLFYVPYLGPLAAGVPPAVEAFLTVSPLAALGLLVIYGVLITIEGYFIVPVVMGQNMELNATTVMLACLFWELVWGLPGLFLAMPLMAAIKAVCRNMPDGQAWANLMSTSRGEIPLRPRSQPEIILAPLDATQILTADEIAGRESATT